MRKIDLSSLPRGGGTGVGGDNINWKKSVGYSIDFIFDDISGIIVISEYIKGTKIKIIYDDNEYVTDYPSLSKCCLSKILGLVTDDFRYKISDVVNNYEIVNTYYRLSSDNKKFKHYKVKCLVCDTICSGSEYSIIKGSCICHICNGKSVKIGFNDLWTTNPEISKLLLRSDDGYKYKNTSKSKVKFLCEDCGSTYTKSVIKAISRGLKCSVCGDGVSFPEKILYSVLTESKLDFKKQMSFAWSDNKRYDAYLKTENILIEIHGRQHYISNQTWGNSIFAQAENDRHKEQMALENGIELITIDARQSEFEFIKGNIINALSRFIDFDLINWEKCSTYIYSNGRKKKIFQMFNDGYDLDTISKQTSYHIAVVEKFLRNGDKMGKCKFRGNGSGVKVYCLTTNILFNSAKKAADFYKLKTPSHIISCCKYDKYHISGEHSVSKEGLRWMYYTEYLKNTNKGVKMKIYLAGKMSGLTFEEMNGWRKNVEKLCKKYNGITTINPVDYYNFEMDEENYTDKEVKDFDLHLVRNCDVILVNLNYTDSIGTAVELHECYENYKVPVVAFASKENCDKIHPWIKCSVSRFEETMEDAINYIVQFYSKICS